MSGMACQLAPAPRLSGGRPHPDGYCTCESHKEGDWDRPEHWRREEVSYLEDRYGRAGDAAIARHLGRTVVGIRLKAKRLGLHKRDAGDFTARAVAQIFGVDEGLVSKVWIRRGLMRSSRAYRAGPNRVHFVTDAEVLRFIAEHGEWFDLDQMPDSPYRDLAAAGGRWYSVPEAARLTGRHPHILSRDMLRGRFPGRKRGTHWYVHETTLPAIRATAGYLGRLADADRVERTLEHRRNVRKGVERPRLPERTRFIRLRLQECWYCRGRGCGICDEKGKVLVPTLRGRVGAYRLPEGWIAA